MKRNDQEGESAPLHPKAAGAQHNETNSCQPPSGTPRSDARPAPSWEDIDSDVALQRGLGYLHARDGFDDQGLPATSIVLVDRPANDPSSDSATKKGFWSDDDFDKTIEITKPDVENVQLYCDEPQQLTTQHRPAGAVASSEARLTTRDFGRERIAGPYSPDSHDLLGLLEGATST